MGSEISRPRRVGIRPRITKIKSSLYSRYYAEAFSEWRAPSPRLGDGQLSSEETSQTWRAVGETAD